MLQTSVAITGATPDDIGCSAATSFVEAAAAAAGIETSTVTFWLEPTTNGGSLLVLQIRVVDQAAATRVVNAMQPELNSATNHVDLLGSSASGTGSSVSWSGDSETTFVVEAEAAGLAGRDAQDIESSESDTDLNILAIVLIAVFAAMTVAQILLMWLCCGCGCGRGAKDSDAGEGRKHKGSQDRSNPKVLPAGSKDSIHRPSGAEAV